MYHLRRRLVELDQIGRVQRQVLGMVTQVPCSFLQKSSLGFKKRSFIVKHPTRNHQLCKQLVKQNKDVRTNFFTPEKDSQFEKSSSFQTGGKNPPTTKWWSSYCFKDQKSADPSDSLGPEGMMVWFAGYPHVCCPTLSYTTDLSGIKGSCYWHAGALRRAQWKETGNDHWGQKRQTQLNGRANWGLKNQESFNRALKISWHFVALLPWNPCIYLHVYLYVYFFFAHVYQFFANFLLNF